MKEINNLKALKILLAIFIFFLIINISTAEVIDPHLNMRPLLLSQGRACEDDIIEAVLIDVDRKPGKFELRIEDEILCSEMQDFREGIAFCKFNVPEIFGQVSIYAYIDDEKVGESNLEINQRIDELGICYDFHGRQIDCSDHCDDTLPHKRYSNVFSVPIPLHFSFGIRDSGEISKPGIPIRCGNLKFPSGTITCHDEFILSSPPYDSPKTECTSIVLLDDGSTGAGEYVKRKIERYEYEWDISFDVFSTLFSEKDIIPMNIGENQYIPLGGESTSCGGEGVLCYTEIPMCGDNVCDYYIGEYCWNCPEDCGSAMDDEFEGNCLEGNIGCVEHCTPAMEFGYVDERGCLIKYKEEGEFTACKRLCDDPNLDLEATESYFGKGDTPHEKLVLNRIGDTFTKRYVCCPEGEYWNIKTNSCSERIGFKLRDITVYAFESPSDYTAVDRCCRHTGPPTGRDQWPLWIRISATFESYSEDTTFNVSSGFTTADCWDTTTMNHPMIGDGFGVECGTGNSPWPEARTYWYEIDDIEVVSDEIQKTIDLDWGCVAQYDRAMRYRYGHMFAYQYCRSETYFYLNVEITSEMSEEGYYQNTRMRCVLNKMECELWIDNEWKKIPIGDDYITVTEGRGTSIELENLPDRLCGGEKADRDGNCGTRLFSCSDCNPIALNVDGNKCKYSVGCKRE